MFIPAGILIGLGAGLLADHPASGVLIGLGLGFIGTALVWVKTPNTNDSKTQDYSRRSSPLFFALMGILLICLGAGIVWTPVMIWPFLAAVFLILLGVWFLYRGFAYRV